jgi:hypothetical protein
VADPYKKQTLDAIWALLEGRSAFAALFNVGNRIHDTRDGWLRERSHRALADYPQVKLSNGRFTHSGFTLPAQPTYAMERSTFPGSTGDWPVRRRCEFVLTLTARDTAADVLDVAEEEAQNALLLAGPRLGLTFVQQWGPLDARQVVVKDANGAERRQSTILIPVLMEFSGRELLTALA